MAFLFLKALNKWFSDGYSAIWWAMHWFDLDLWMFSIRDDRLKFDKLIEIALYLSFDHI